MKSMYTVIYIDENGKRSSICKNDIVSCREFFKQLSLKKIPIKTYSDLVEKPKTRTEEIDLLISQLKSKPATWKLADEYVKLVVEKNSLLKN